MTTQEPRHGASCLQCGNCCRWPGFVCIEEEETETIARFLGLTVPAFAARYTRLLPSRSGLSLNEMGDGACAFLDDNLCRIHAVKPRQCRDFPAGWTRDEFETQCKFFRETKNNRLKTQPIKNIIIKQLEGVAEKFT